VAEVEEGRPQETLEQVLVHGSVQRDMAMLEEALPVLQMAAMAATAAAPASLMASGR
jgi:hypothetical protein